MQVDVNVRGDEEARRLVDTLARRMSDQKPALFGIVDLLIEAHQSRFQGRGVRWRKPSEITQRIDAQLGRDPRPLRLTGNLAQSLTQRGHPDQIVRFTPTSVTFGTRAPSAYLHHKGKGVPRRTVVGLTRVQRQGLVAELHHRLVEGL